MYLALFSIVVFVAAILLGQRKQRVREKIVKKYFLDNKLRFVLVCKDSEMTTRWLEEIDKDKYSEIEILDIESLRKSKTALNSEILDTQAQRLGVMKYPCLIEMEENQLRARFFEGN